MYALMCIRNLRNYRYKEILSNCHSQHKYIYCQANAHKEIPPNNARNFSSNRNIHKTLLNDHAIPYIYYYAPNFNASLRNLSLSSRLQDKEPLKPSSKIEATIQRMKDKKKDLETLPATEPPKAVVKKSIPQRVWAELVHYYHGFRLLFIDIRVSSGLAWRILNGKTLTRRENNLLVRTVGDMFRLVPFSVFILVPFLELTLPIFLKLFPGMLPSTFQTVSEREDKMKKNLKVKLEMAKFLQKTLDEMSVQHSDRNSKSAKEFAEWFTKVRTSGQQVSNVEIMKFSKLFQDEITLDSLSRGQLVALCRVLEVQTLGTNNLLRFQLRMKLRSLKADDKLIQKEGLDSLNVYELQQACRARGMRAYGMPEDRLKQQLASWLDLSLNQKVPPSLLLLSRALMLPEKIPTSDKLKATISVLPDTIIAQTKAAIGETEGKIDNKVKYEVLKEEVRKIKEEREERREEQKRKQKDVLIDKAPILELKPAEELKDAPELTIEDQSNIKKKEPQITAKDLGVLEDAIENLAQSKKKLILEKEKIEDLKEEMADYQEDLQELHSITADKPKPDIKESVAAKRLYNRVNKMIKKLDTVVTQLENKEEQLKKQAVLPDSGTTQEDVVRIDELLNAIRKLQKVPNESVVKQIKNILGKMDDDHDGSIKVDEVLKVIQLIGKENVQLSPKQLDEVVDLLDKEEILEVEDKIEKALLKVKNSIDASKASDKPVEGVKPSEKAADTSKPAADSKASESGSCQASCPPKPSSPAPCPPDASGTKLSDQSAQPPLKIPPVSIDPSKDKDKPTQL